MIIDQRITLCPSVQKADVDYWAGEDLKTEDGERNIMALQGYEKQN